MGIGEMKMKHRLVLSLCAVAVAACMSGVALADTDIALNLRYTDPADPPAQWQAHYNVSQPQQLRNLLAELIL